MSSYQRVCCPVLMLVTLLWCPALLHADPKPLLPSIRTYAELFNSNTDPHWTPDRQQWVKTHLDMTTTPSTLVGGPFANIQLPYTNWQDMSPRESYQSQVFDDLVQAALQAQVNIDSMYLHFGEDVSVKLADNQSLMEDRFYRIYRFIDKKREYTDETVHAYGDRNFEVPYSSKMTIAAEPNDMVYMGNLWKFRVMAFHIRSPASKGWQAVFEYWNGKGWAALPFAQDAAGRFARVGRAQVTFIPPTDWQTTAVPRAAWPANVASVARPETPLYWVRVRCTHAGRPPFLNTYVTVYNAGYRFKGVAGIGGEKFARDGKGRIVVPGWDPRNDANGDGYVDDAEFARRVNPKASARFPWQSHVPSGYLTGRWLMHMADPFLQRFASSFLQDLLAHPAFSGVFIDNIDAYILDILFLVPPPNAVRPPSPQTDYAHFYLEYPDDKTYQTLGQDLLKARIEFLNAVKKALPNKKVMVNWGGDPLNDLITSTGTPTLEYPAPQIVEKADVVLHEYSLSWKEAALESPFFLENYSQLVNHYCLTGKEVVMHSNPSLTPSSIAAARDKLWALSRYLLTSNTCTFFNYQNSANYDAPWRDWFDGIAYDAGTPNSSWFQLSDSGADSGRPAIASAASFGAYDNVYGRWFENALVLNKSRWHIHASPRKNSESQVAINLGGTYYPLRPDGSFGPATQKIVLADFEGAILAKVCGTRPCGSANK